MSLTENSETSVALLSDQQNNEDYVEDVTGHSNVKSTSCKAEFKPGSLDQISSHYESLDYDPILNTLWIDECRSRSYSYEVRKDLCLWCVCFVIGILTAIVAASIDLSIVFLSSFKYSWLQYETDRCVKEGCLFLPYIMWLFLNAVPASVAALLGSYVEPVSAGSGIPQVKCYLNGIKIPRVVRIKTLISKAVGVTFSVLGGLAVGKEGPMIHSGAVIAAGISQGKTTTFNYDFGILKEFRDDTDKRDFVSAGAAAGVAAAFGAPVGGVLFSLEEGASFWNQALTWRVFFTALISGFTLNVILSTFHGQSGELNNPGLLNFGKFDDLTYQFFEFVPFMVMGAIGGLLGALFNHLNYKLSVLRFRHINRPRYKILEVILVSIVTASVAFLMIYAIEDCRDIDTHRGGYPIQMFCKAGEESTAATLLLKTPEEGVRSLFHDPKGAYGWRTVGSFFVVYFLLACCTYGLGVPSGLFIPTLLAGAAWGRIIGMLMGLMFPNQTWVDEGKYALVGAAAMLGGVVRMTISLTVILMECVGNITFGLPLMIVVMISKWVGDFFNEGIYDIHIRLSGAPLMPWEPPRLSDNIFASEVMSSPVITVNLVESVDKIAHILHSCAHNGFPVVDNDTSGDEHSKQFGKLRGLVLRSQLIVLLKNKVFNENSNIWVGDDVNSWLFREAYPRFPTIDDIELTSHDLESSIDLRPFMNPSPYTVTSSATLQRMFRLFRALGLRHLIVLNDEHRIVGIVTRKDLVKFRLLHYREGVVLRQLEVYD